MKLNIIGFGQCGGRIADEFAVLNSFAHSSRGIEIAPCIIAVNTDSTDLSGLKAIRKDYHHRILIGSRKTSGHGVGKINELGAEIAKENSDKIFESVRREPRFLEADAFLLIASAGGGTGSGAVSVITKLLRERYADKPLYNLIVLPFEHEETTEERTVYNAAICLKSAYSAADAVFLVDNQRYVKKDNSILNNIAKINHSIVAPFYNLLCAGEEKKPKFIGSKTLDAGDIIQTLRGWTAIGYGKSELDKFNLSFKKKSDFDKKSAQTLKGIRALDEAMSELSIVCNPADAGTALYLLSGPAKETNVDILKEIGDYLRGKAPKSIIRNGDYPREKDSLNVHVVLSGLTDVEKVRRYYSKSTDLIPEFKKRQEEGERKIRDLEELGDSLPSLI
ncbi:MAG: tubulin/FtsZ family protein [Dehalococcoidales bacterium]|nr:tubulin/FtsZ family protein [Dehalococcoidales bacterium]